MKKTMSVEQVEANRANALKSTGPKSAEGKAISRMNGYKHGLLAREVVVRGLHDGERGRNFQTLQRLYWEQLAPVGPLEEMMVERIVTVYWRLHRVLIAERGEILQSLEASRARSEMTMNGGVSLPTLTPQWTYRASGALAEARDCVRGGGDLTGPVLERLLKALEGRPGMIDTIERIREGEIDGMEGLSGEAQRAKRQERLSGFLDQLLDCCEEGLREKAESDEWEARASRDASLMPTQKVVERILRYETRLERQLYRAMNQLERLQRLRKGEVVPPPVAIQVS